MITCKCPHCQEELSVPGCQAGQSETCPTCGRTVNIPRQPASKFRPPQVDLTASVSDDTQTDEEEAEWRKFRHDEIMDNVREDISDQREFEKEMRSIGVRYPEDKLAGWLLQIGPQCHAAKPLDGLLVLRKDALKKPGFFPPYDTCREATCECDILPVTVGEVPPGTHVTERA